MYVCVCGKHLVQAHLLCDPIFLTKIDNNNNDNDNNTCVVNVMGVAALIKCGTCGYVDL